ncbi:hypothetical protein DOTSEDRAFT_86852 [Dothistroma septosporum NZE10]|uniref:Uncharacterized protein n=1 Tax=Dothistroma septosporum (strain NZE10 / CBS 128990) TaxID=675120 RepID=N1PTG7_DOTSN|nr:hypothetical protein DOTSEDRAFT_86852 [Dothistroma septosporum NZE10]
MARSPCGHSSVPPCAHALPSPADFLNTPPDPPLNSHLPQSPGVLRRALRFDDSAAALPPIPDPGHVDGYAVTTPLADEPVFPDMNLIVGGALAPTHSDPPRQRRPSRPSPSLRLPSFQTLGIAAPHPDRFGSLSFQGVAISAMDGPAADIVCPKPNIDPPAAIGAGYLSPCDLAPRLGEKPSLPGGRAVPTSIKHDVATLTPPAELGEMQWLSIRSVSNAPMDSPSTDPGNLTASFEEPRNGGRAASGADTLQPANRAHQPLWLDGAVNVLLQNLRTAAMPSNPLRVLSHALPSPSPEGHMYSKVIEAIHGSTPTSPTIWINVFHAIQGRFNLADLPTSPPATPGPPNGGEDYFTQKVFDSAVPISDYQEDLSSLPRSPRPVVPPSSINISIVERYIPPTSANEFRDMFNPSGPSLLVDRLVELSPNNGSLVFVYPTKAGADRFLKEYLSPILDPILRTIQVTNGLSSDLGRTLGTMAAANQLPDYDQMLRAISRFCTILTQRSSSMERFYGRRTTFSLAHASKEEVVVKRAVWTKDWWAKQEKQRIRDAMSKYTQEAQKKSSNEHVERAPTPTELLQQLLREVAERGYAPGQDPEEAGRGIEVSVFVIKRLE